MLDASWLQKPARVSGFFFALLAALPPRGDLYPWRVSGLRWELMIYQKKKKKKKMLCVAFLMPSPYITCLVLVAFQ